jgi:hypothetical protein
MRGGSTIAGGLLTDCWGCWLCAQITQASFFGVGAPEALLVGVVALVVFGPKGLAEVRFNLQPVTGS